MPINKVVRSFEEAVSEIADGAVIMVGGFGTVTTCPSLLLEALAQKGVKNLTTISNTTGFGPDVWKIMGFDIVEDMDILVRNGRIRKAIVSAPVSTVFENTFERLLRAGGVDMEMVPQGTLAERVRCAKAGIAGFYTPVGVGTIVEEGKETKVIDGRTYLLEYAIKADFALIRARKADRWGNLVYRGTSRTFNETMAGAATVTIAEVDEVVELGELDAEAIITPGVYVDRVVERPKDLGKLKAEEEKELDAAAVESHKRFLERKSG